MSTNTLVRDSHGAEPNSPPSKEAYVIAKYREMGLKLHTVFLQAWGVLHPCLCREIKTPLAAERVVFQRRPPLVTEHPPRLHVY